MRKLALLTVLLAAPLFASSTAAAQAEPLTGVCSFPITVELSKGTGGKFHPIPTEHAQFVATFTGLFFNRITNVETGKSLEVNTSGPFLIIGDDSFIATGTILFFFGDPRFPVPTGDIPTPGLFLVSGPVLVNLNEEGSVVSTELLGGHIRPNNLCDVLAAQ
jgi:hypothetical protein